MRQEILRTYVKCMKFATHTPIILASWRDVELVGKQNTITNVQLKSSTSNTSSTGSVALDYGRNLVRKSKDEVAVTMSWFLLILSAAVCGFAGWQYKDAKDRAEEGTIKEPLVPSTGVTA